MKVAYIRVSTVEQNETRQLEAMKNKGIEKYFTEKVSGKDTNRPQLKAMLDFVREGDTVYIHPEAEYHPSTTLQKIIDQVNGIYTERHPVRLDIVHHDHRADRIICLKEPSGKDRLIIRGCKARSRITRKDIRRTILDRLLLTTHQIVRCGSRENDDTHKDHGRNTQKQCHSNDQFGERQSRTRVFCQTSCHINDLLPRKLISPENDSRWID